MRKTAMLIVELACLCAVCYGETGMSDVKQVCPGVWRVRFGVPEAMTPVSVHNPVPYLDGLNTLPNVTEPVDFSRIQFTVQDRGCRVMIPVERPGEDFFGFGLQFKSVRQTGLKRVMRVNADPPLDTGDSHAPVPMVVSSKGYAVYVDTARYVSFYVASHVQPGSTQRFILVDVPSAQGVDVYFFAGPDVRHAVQRYNLFSGGGCLPPLWGLGMYYRGDGKFCADDAVKLAESFRTIGLPFDVFGLEPGWHSHAYSCTYSWNQEKFPDPDAFIGRMTSMGYRLNLWEHAFVHPQSPIYADMRDKSGDVEVWQGLVPDFTLEAARDVFGGYHARTLVAKGIAGFKLDECDNSDYIGDPWSFPEASRFPSGLDGEQMHSLLGVLYQRTMWTAYQKANRRTYGQVRSSHALASPYPYAIYSDLYDHRDYIRALVNAGFSGLLWMPEVRSCGSVEDMMRRLQSVVFSPMAQVDSWYIKNPPWRQFDREKNNRDEFLPNYPELEQQCIQLFNWRMRLIPYLYAAFARYRFEGIPPFRALAMDYPRDMKTYTLDSEYMMGDNLLVAPLFDKETKRKVYLPEGQWFDLWTQEKFDGGEEYDREADLNTIPVFVKANTLLPLAVPVTHVADDTIFDVTVYAFGETCAPFVLFEDDGLTYDYEKGECSRVGLEFKGGKPNLARQGTGKARKYEISGWRQIPTEAVDFRKL